MVYKRRAQTYPEPGVDPAAWTLPNKKQGQILRFEDVNSLYPTTMLNELPVGRPIVFTAEPGEGLKRVVNTGAKKGNASKISFSWLNLMQRKFSSRIQCALNNDEKKIGDFYLDGFVVENGKKIGMDFLGCRWHPCTKCGIFIGDSFSADRHEKRAEFLKNALDEYHTIWECEFRKLPICNEDNLSAFFTKDVVTEADFLEAVVTGRFKGLAMVDINCPRPAQEKFLRLNHPPIAVKRVVTPEMVHENFRDQAEYTKIPQLTLGFSATQYVIASPLLRYYLESGLTVTRVWWVAEYQFEKCFEPFINKLVAQRVEATKNSNKPQEQLAKLLLNSSWGRLAMNLSRRKNTIYCRKSEINEKTTLHTKNLTPMTSSSYPCDLFEMTKDKKSQTDSIPVHLALTILQYSKLHMLQYLEFLDYFMRPGSFEVCYQDTDSFLFLTEADWPELVKDSLKEEFEAKKYQWYLRNDSPEELRFPGKPRI